MADGGLLLGHYPARYVLFENDKLHTIISALNYRGIRYVPVADHGGMYRGMLRVGRVLEKLLGIHKGTEEAPKLALVEAREVMDPSVPSVEYPPRDVGDIVKVMEEHRVGGVAITTAGRLVGEVTDKILLDLLVTSSKIGVSVGDIATPSPVTVEATDPLHRALSLMVERGIRRLPVTYQGELVGMLSARDYFRFLSTRLEEEGVLGPWAMEEQIWYVASPRPITIGAEEDASRAIDLLRREGVGSLIVVDSGGRLVGILTERDVVLRLPRGLLEDAAAGLPRL